MPSPNMKGEDGPPPLAKAFEVGESVENVVLARAALLHGQDEAVQAMERETGRGGLQNTGSEGMGLQRQDCRGRDCGRAANLRPLDHNSMNSDKMTLMLLSLGNGGFCDAMFQELLTALSRTFSLVCCDSAPIASFHLQSGNIRVVLVPDSDIMEHNSLHPLLSRFVWSGGSVIFCGGYSSSVRLPRIGPFFSSLFGLTWSAGQIARTTFELNGATVLGNRPGLPQSCNAKAVMLSGVAGNQALYRASQHSYKKSPVFALEQVSSDQTAIAFAKVGSGFVGYVGDVKAEPKSVLIVWEMCMASSEREKMLHTLAAPKTPVPVPRAAPHCAVRGRL